MKSAAVGGASRSSISVGPSGSKGGGRGSGLGTVRASSRGLPDLDSVLSGDSRTTYRMRATGGAAASPSMGSSDYYRSTGSLQSGKQAALDDIERAMASGEAASGEGDSIDRGSSSTSSGMVDRSSKTGAGGPAGINAVTAQTHRRMDSAGSNSIMASGSLPLPDSPAMMSRTGRGSADSDSTGAGGVGTGRSAALSKNPSSSTDGGLRPAGMPLKAYELLGNSSPVIGSDTSSSPVLKQRSRLPSDTGTVTRNSLRSNTAGSADDGPPTVSSLAAAVESPKIRQQREQRERDRATSLMSDHGSIVHVNPDTISAARSTNTHGRDRQLSTNSVLRKVRSRDYGSNGVGQLSSATVNTQGLGIENEVERYASVSSGSAGDASARKQKKLVKGSDETVGWLDSAHHNGLIYLYSIYQMQCAKQAVSSARPLAIMPAIKGCRTAGMLFFGAVAFLRQTRLRKLDLALHSTISRINHLCRHCLPLTRM